MVRLLVNMVISLIAAAIGMIVAASLLDDFQLNVSGFVVAVVIFAVAQAVLGPFVARTAARNVPQLLGGIGLVTTFIALVLADLFSDGISINGIGTWIIATLIVWVATLIALIIVPFVLVKLGVESARKRAGN